MILRALIFTTLFSALGHSLERKDFSFLRGENFLGKEVVLHSDDWGVKPPKPEDFKAYKGQSNSLVEWDSLDPNEWLDFNQWKLQRERQDRTPEWRIKARDLLHQEVVGKVIQCLNDCVIHTGKGQSRSQYGSVIKEGYEFSTGVDSYAWIYLADATIVRVSPQTSISFLEINVTEQKVFFSARLNEGHVYLEHRKLGSFPKRNLAQTDLAMLPLMLKKANREHYARYEFNMLSETQRLSYALEDNFGYVSQYDELNRLMGEQAQNVSKFESEFFIFTANASFALVNPVAHIFHEVNGESWFRMESAVPELLSEEKRPQEALVYFRGHTNNLFNKVPEDMWHSMNPEGTEFRARHETQSLKTVRYFTRRIPSIHLAREILLRQDSRFLFEEFDRKNLAIHHGYRLWNELDELDKRKKFLLEYTRRLETTNLIAVASVFKDKKVKGFGREYYIEAIRRSLSDLKSLHDAGQEVVKESNEAEYYLWILKNAKEFMPTYTR